MPWKTRSFRCAGIGFLLKANSIWPFSLKDSFQAFRAMNSRPALLFMFNRVPARRTIRSNFSSPQGRSFSIAALSGIDSPLLAAPQIRNRLPACLKNPKTLALELKQDSVTMIDFAHGRSDFFYYSDSANACSEIGFGPAMLAPFLPSFDALLLHAAAIERRGKAAVFLAADEGGKTTAVRLAPGGTILGDDQVIVRRSRGRFRVHGTPWGLHVDAKLQAPLAGLFLLQKAERFALEPLTARELVPRIWQEIKNPLAILPKPLKEKAFAILCDIAQSVPAWKMAFPKDHIDWNAVDRALV